jgi:hypothetical protein
MLSKDGRHKALKLELQVRNALHKLSALITTMHSELSLLPVRTIYFSIRYLLNFLIEAITPL